MGYAFPKPGLGSKRVAEGLGVRRLVALLSGHFYKIRVFPAGTAEWAFSDF